MIRLCLFDLDQTLVDTDDLKELREAGKRRSNAAYRRELTSAIKTRDRGVFDFLALNLIKMKGPDMKMGVFTRSPRRYVDIILEQIPFDWDVVITYEDVDHYKPHGQGVIRAMKAVGLGKASHLSEVLLIGDSDVDIRAAYHAGCHAALFKQAWPRTYQPTHWHCMKLLPDMVADNIGQLLKQIDDPAAFLPDLECLLEGGNIPSTPRFDEIGKFYPDSTARHLVYAAGRYFVHDDSLERRRSWHKLTQSILDHKEATEFPPEWIQTIRRFIAYHYRLITAMPSFGGTGPEVVVTAIPARPGREHRLGYLIKQLRDSYGDRPMIKGLRLLFDPQVLAYRDGVQSQSHDHLDHKQRMANVRDHLFVYDEDAVRGKRVLVIDDVTTTGATLLYAKKYLEEAGAKSVDLFSLAQTISNPLRYP